MIAPTDREREPAENGCANCGRPTAQDGCRVAIVNRPFPENCSKEEHDRMMAEYYVAARDCDAHALDWRSLYFARAREGAADPRPASLCMTPGCKRAPHADGECWLCPACAARAREGAASEAPAPRRQLEELIHVDATPDADYPARVLRAQLAANDSGARWIGQSLDGGAEQLAAMMNGWAAERAELLRAALVKLGAPIDQAVADGSRFVEPAPPPASAREDVISELPATVIRADEMTASIGAGLWAAETWPNDSGDEFAIEQPDPPLNVGDKMIVRVVRVTPLGGSSDCPGCDRPITGPHRFGCTVDGRGATQLAVPVTPFDGGEGSK